MPNHEIECQTFFKGYEVRFKASAPSKKMSLLLFEKSINTMLLLDKISNEKPTEANPLVN